ncbi:MAG TPA: zf-HC2 domain-containing protein [Acidobacteriaceae bacterium]|nr:zf-HC2 domain-containing protein [Acidobacteriaceae bacterium]
MEWNQGRDQCEGFEVLLEDSIEGGLTGEEAKKLDAHLTACAACREALEDAKLSRQLLQFGEPAAQASPAFARIVMARIRSSQEQSGQAGLLQTLVAFASRLAITATLALGVLIAYTAVNPPATAMQPALMSADTHAGLFTDPAQQVETRDGFLRLVAESSHGQK